MGRTVFVTGATGVLGRGVVARLTTAGHHVRAVARTPEREALLARLGAEPVAVDLFDADAVRRAVAGCDTVLHLATSIPPIHRVRSREAWADNDRLRRDATAVLVDAALAEGVTTLVAESITFVYADGGDAWLDEDAPVEVPEGSPLRSALALEAAVAGFTAAGGRGIVLRFGMFAGPEARSTDEALRTARAGAAFTVGRPGAFAAAIHTDDAADAVVAALDAPPGVYNVVDDEPLTRRAHNDAFTDAFGLRRGRFVPEAVARAVGGPGAAALSRSQRVSNRRFRDATGWAPRHPDARAAWTAVAATRGDARDAAPRRLRVPLALLAAVGFWVGAWAAFAPQSFFDDFPGLGQVWVAVDGPYNEHLVRDYGALNLALGVLSLLAWRSPTRPLVTATAGAWIAYSTPHLVYHLRHLALFDGVDAVTLVAGLGALLALGSLVLLWRNSPVPERASSARA